MNINRKKKSIIIVVTMVIIVAFLVGVISEYGTPNVSILEAYKKTISNTDIIEFSEINILENKSIELNSGKFSLKLDTETTRFEITDNQSGAVWSSFPKEEVKNMAGDDAQMVNSNIGIVYYDADSKVHYMGSYADSVERKQYSIYKKGNTIRIIYTVGKDTSSLLNPSFITKEDMEKKILPNLKVNEKTKIKLYYKLHSPAKKGVYQDQVDKYDSLKNKYVYVLNPNLSDEIMEEIGSLLKSAGFTKDMEKSGLKELGVENAFGSTPACYKIPVEFTLDEKGFTASVISAGIESSNDTDVLTDIYLLEYFGATGADAKGFFLVPDGSGAQINLNQPTPRNYIQHIFNDDLMLQYGTETQGEFCRGVPIPYFGLVSENRSFFAKVEGGADCGSIFARTMGGSNSLNMIGARFKVRQFDQTDIGEKRNLPLLNIYANKVSETLKVHYNLIPGNPKISEFADCARQEFSNCITDSIENSNSIPLYIDFLCLSYKKSSVLGIDVSTPVTMSTLNDISSIVDKLHKEGITNLAVRLKGWTEEGLNYGAFDKCKLSKKVGTEKELKELNKKLCEKGGHLYLDTDFTFAKKNDTFDSLHSSRDLARSINRKFVILKDYDPVTLKRNNKMRQGYVMSPLSYMTFAESFLNSFNKTFDNTMGISWANAGMYNLMDYNKDHQVDGTSHITSEVLNTIKGYTEKLMTDYGNIYTLQSVSDIVNLPINSSRFISEDTYIPFYQMIVSGKKNYSGPALNLSVKESSYLDMAASSAAPYYVLITKDDSVINKADLQDKYYSLNYEVHINNIITSYKNYNREVSGTLNKQIIDFTWLTDKVSLTVYEGGTQMVVNRSGSDFMFDNIVIPARDYKMVQ